MTGMTEKQRLVLAYVYRYTLSSGFPPSIREIGHEFGISSLRGVTVHLDALQRKGFLTRQHGVIARSIRLTPAGRQALGHAASPPDAVARIVQIIRDEAQRHIDAVQSVDPTLTGAIKRLRYTAGVVEGLAATIAETFKDTEE